MTLQIEIYSDYVCPYCFLAEKPIEEAIRLFDEPVTLEWRPFELRPHPTPTLTPEGAYLQNTWRDSVYPLAEQMGIKIVLPRVSPQPYTRLAFEGALFARDHGHAPDYNHRVFAAFFQEERDIGRPEVLGEIAGDCGLDVAAFNAALGDRRYQEECGRLLSHATETLGVSAVPTLVVGRYALPGLLAPERLAGILHEIQNRGDEPAQYEETRR
jgi:predicted DsbA family dithiol-disulfide isomerase